MEKYIAESLSEYIDKTILIAKQERDIWYRGHSNASYRLTPTVLRETQQITDARGNKIDSTHTIISSGGGG